MVNYKIENGRLVFDCGCSFKIVGEKIFPNSDMPAVKFNPDLRDNDHDVNFECKETYDILSRGMTTSIFQLETPLGKQYSKKLRPENIEHIGALGAILRPGAMKALDDKGISMTNHYCLRKNLEEEVPSYHPVLDNILKDAYGCLIYQEQSINIGRQIAGFTLEEADELRRAASKKKPEEMAKMKKLFLEKSKIEKVVTEEQAEEIFGWIEKSQRYSFPLAHAMGYGITTYVTAYLKTHFPLVFYRKWLEFAKEKQDPLDEISKLVQDAKLFDIEVLPPDIRYLRKNFHTDGKTIFFGLTDIKGVGESQFKKLKSRVEEISIDLNKMTWMDFLLKIADHISSTVVERLISTGALRCFGLHRQRMLFEYAKWNELTKTEKGWILERVDNFVSLYDALIAVSPTKKNGGGCHTEKRSNIVNSLAKLLDNPPFSLDDSIDWISWTEESFLGVAITCTNLDNYNSAFANSTCRDVVKGNESYCVLGVEIKRVSEIKTKKGKNPGKMMGFLTVADDTGELDSVIVFPNVWEQVSDLLTVGNMVFLRGKLNEQKSFQVEKVYQMEQN